jgi:hypothetical protein
MRTKEEYILVKKLHSEGYNNTVISNKTGIPRSTIKDWTNNSPKAFSDKKRIFYLKKEIIKNKKLHGAYSYLLGLYLGDGYINKCNRTYRMRIALDKKYIELNDFARANMCKIFVNNKVGEINSEGCIYLSVYNNELQEIFPQHGPGCKHNRKINLLKWQSEILINVEFMRGLIHSDGCFYKEIINNKYHYDRFMFSNKSADLHELFQSTCDKINLEYDFQHKGDGIWQTRISKKDSVNKLKQIIGTKEMPM